MTCCRKRRLCLFSTKGLQCHLQGRENAHKLPFGAWGFKVKSKILLGGPSDLEGRVITNDLNWGNQQLYISMVTLFNLSFKQCPGFTDLGLRVRFGCGVGWRCVRGVFLKASWPCPGPSWSSRGLSSDMSNHLDCGFK